MMLKGAKQCCGCWQLVVGVELICLIHLIVCILVIANTSSVNSVHIGGAEVNPFFQVVNGAWCLLGIPIIIGAAVGAWYRMESSLRIYYYYLLVSFIMKLAYMMYFIVSGSICSVVVSNDVAMLGNANFICGFTDTFAFFWIFIESTVELYLIYIIWSAANEVRHTMYPNLLSYAGKLKNASKMAEGSPVPVPSVGPPVGGPNVGPNMGPNMQYGTGATGAASRGMPVSQSASSQQAGGGQFLLPTQNMPISMSQGARPQGGFTAANFSPQNASVPQSGQRAGDDPRRMTRAYGSQ